MRRHSGRSARRQRAFCFARARQGGVPTPREHATAHHGLGPKSVLTADAHDEGGVRGQVVRAYLRRTLAGTATLALAVLLVGCNTTPDKSQGTYPAKDHPQAKAEVDVPRRKRNPSG